MATLVIDFSEHKDTKLFTGARNGVKHKSVLGLRKSQEYTFVISPDQLVTSSFFIGLLKRTLDRYPTKEIALKHFVIDNLEPIVKSEFIRALGRYYQTKQ